jgi:hypothetical protein
MLTLENSLPNDPNLLNTESVAYSLQLRHPRECAVQIFNHGLKILKNFPNTLRSSPY